MGADGKRGCTRHTIENMLFVAFNWLWHECILSFDAVATVQILISLTIAVIIQS